MNWINFQVIKVSMFELVPMHEHVRVTLLKKGDSILISFVVDTTSAHCEEQPQYFNQEESL